jgi:hypothetical protein
VARQPRAPEDDPESRDRRAGGQDDGGDRAGGVPEIFRKMMALGFSGLFTTEAAIRGALGDSVPRDWVDFLSDQSERTRAEFTQRLAEEFGKVLRDVDLAALASELLEGRTIEVQASIRLSPRDEDADPGDETR